jgi:g-D-glutamyl-meso-diaminopimelate peptidase
MKVKARQGDSLCLYSELFTLPLECLTSCNDIRYSSLTIGSEVNIPGYKSTLYTIKKGDNISNLSQQRNISVDLIRLMNQNQNLENLTAGDVLCLPQRITKRIVNVKQDYHYDCLVKDINILKKIYPFIIVQSIGKSVLGNDLFEIKIGNGKKKVHFNGSFHANEWITTSVIMQYVNDYLLALTNNGSITGYDMKQFFHNVTLSIVPMVNPDGVNLVLKGIPDQEPYRSNVLQINKHSKDFSNWKANIRGVDLNNQYPSYWEIEKERKDPKSPAPRDYPGDHPLTEPEAIAMARLTNYSDFSKIVAFHTQGKEIYWGYLNHEPPIAQEIVNEFVRVSGYKAVKDIDSHAGYRDWYILTYKRPGFTVELGEGVNPLPLTQFEEIYQNCIGIFMASLYT